MKNKVKVVVGISGGIAAYKAADLVSKIAQEDIDVQVIMTQHAAQFITPLTFAALSHKTVLTGNFESSNSGEISHIRIMEEASLVIIAPATANVIAKLAHGIADDILTTSMLMVRSPVILAPAMNVQMYKHPATETNLNILKERGFHIVGPAAGHLACGYIGEGRMEEPEKILRKLKEILLKKNSLKDIPILITAGATREHWDPVRFLSNPSTGKMGYALAQEAASRGAKVTLVSGPSNLEQPRDVHFYRITSADEMSKVVRKEFPKTKVFIGAAAVSDYRPIITHKEKLKKDNGSINIKLERTEDILKEAGEKKDKRQILVGFAAETERLKENALEKLNAKKLDLIVANNVSEPGSGFGTNTNKALIINKTGQSEEFPLMSKEELAKIILDKIELIVFKS